MIFLFDYKTCAFHFLKMVYFNGRNKKFLDKPGFKEIKMISFKFLFFVDCSTLNKTQFLLIYKASQLLKWIKRQAHTREALWCKEDEPALGANNISTTVPPPLSTRGVCNV